MSRIIPVIKREFLETVKSRAFKIATVVGPLLIFGIFAIQFLIIAKGGGGLQRIAVVDATGQDLGHRVAMALEEHNAKQQSFIQRATYKVDEEKATDADKAAVRDRLAKRIVADSLDGFLWLPSTTESGTGISYEGGNATNSPVMQEIHNEVQRVIQSDRLKKQGIDEAQLQSAMQPVDVEIAKTGKNGAAGNSGGALILAFGMAFATYMVVLMYGQSIMSSVGEEKRDRVVELIVSSIRARDVLLGKIVGIGAAGVLQMMIWVAAAALLITRGGVVAKAFHASPAMVQALSHQTLIPHVPISVAIIFLIYFAGGFFLFATMFAMVGAIVTSAAEEKQFLFPVLIPFMIGLFMAQPTAGNPNSPMAVIGSLIPFTAPIVMPVRTSVTVVPWSQLILSMAILFGTATLIIMLASKIYRTAIFATGKKPSLGEIMHWMKSA